MFRQDSENNAPIVIILMGVSGSGKTTIGQMLCRRLGWEFYDGDDLHPPENVAKMARGEPLDDGDRRPWLSRLRQVIDGHLARNSPALIICSALKQSYRDQLDADARLVRFVWLRGDYDLIRRRMEAREGHYMKASMLESQFRTLEPPQGALALDIDHSPEAIVEEIVTTLSLRAV